MEERLVEITKSRRRHKKYAAVVEHKRTGRRRTIHFGHSDYQHYRDRTKVGAWSHADHGDRERLRRYYTRFSGVASRAEGIKLERVRSRGLFNAKLLSHLYLW